MTPFTHLSTVARLTLAALVSAIVALALVVGTASAATDDIATYTLKGAKTITPAGFSPAITEGGFSGLDPIDPFGLTYWTISDRGPNGIVSVAGKDRRTFLAPAFTPTIYRVAVNPFDGSLRILQRIPLHLPKGAVDPARAVVGGNPNEITGLYNTEADPANGITVADEKSYNVDGTVPLPVDPYGLDTEAVQQDPRDGSFWISDEYRPSLIHVSKNGTLLSRIIPSATNVAGHGAVPLKPILPNAWKSLRQNRGIEGATISPDGKTLWAIMQNTLNIKANAADNVKYYRNIRLAEIDIRNANNPVLKRELIYRMDQLSTTNPDVQDQLRISELTYQGKDKLLVDERDDTRVGANKILYSINLRNATDVKSLDLTGIEAADDAALAARGIKPVAKTPYVDFGAAGYPWDKLEGIGLLFGGKFVATVDDDDFGFNQDKVTGVVTKSDKPTQLIIYKR